MGQNSSKSEDEGGSKESETKVESNQSNGEAKLSHRRKEKRMSFYETVDASEVLPYLIIGNYLASWSLFKFTCT